MCILLIHKLGSKWSPFQKNINYSSNVSGKRSKIMEKSGKIREFHDAKNVGTLKNGFNAAL